MVVKVNLLNKLLKEQLCLGVGLNEVWDFQSSGFSVLAGPSAHELFYPSHAELPLKISLCSFNSVSHNIKSPILFCSMCLGTGQPQAAGLQHREAPLSQAERKDVPIFPSVLTKRLSFCSENKTCLAGKHHPAPLTQG